MIRCVRLWSGPDNNSHFEEGVIDLEPGPRSDMLSGSFPIGSVSFQETNSDPKLGWHVDPARQLVITLSGTLEFVTHDGRFSLRSGDVLFTEDTSGTGRFCCKSQLARSRGPWPAGFPEAFGGLEGFALCH
jgi:hypothetical protein